MKLALLTSKVAIMSSMSDLSIRMFSRGNKVLRSKAGKTVLEPSMLETETTNHSDCSRYLHRHSRYVLELE